MHHDRALDGTSGMRLFSALSMGLGRERSSVGHSLAMTVESL